MVVGVGGVVVRRCLLQVRRLVGVPLSALVPRGRAVGQGWTAFFLVARCCSSASRSSPGASAILNTVLGPALHARLEELASTGSALALGFGYLVAEAVRDEPALGAVRGDPADGDRVDMIIATLPLAVLLVEMMVQSLRRRACTSTRCSRRTCSGGSATRSCTCCSSRRSPSTTCSSRAMPAARSSPATSSPSAGRSRSSRTSSSGRTTSTSTIRSARRRPRSTPRCSR